MGTAPVRTTDSRRLAQDLRCSILLRDADSNGRPARTIPRNDGGDAQQRAPGARGHRPRIHGDSGQQCQHVGNGNHQRDQPQNGPGHGGGITHAPSEALVQCEHLRQPETERNGHRAADEQRDYKESISGR